MALITLTSASGSPGVTTTALGLALVWPRPVVLVDADPTGAKAIQAGYFRGGQMPTDATIVDLAVSYQRGTIGQDLPAMLSQFPRTDVQFLAGPSRHNQARALDGAWDALGETFKALERNGQDVIVDLGRLGLEGFALDLAMAADLTLLMVRSNLPALVAAASWAETLDERFAQIGATGSLGIGVVGKGMPHDVREIAHVLRPPVMTTLVWDPTSAEVFSRGAPPSRGFPKGNLVRSLTAAAEAISVAVADAGRVTGARS